MPGKEAKDQGYICPRRPQAHTFDVGVSGQVANCAAASTGACLEGGGADPDCCAVCGEGSCAPGYFYAGQFVFDEETLSSTYPDFFRYCGELAFCGNTCCVPSDEWGGARVAAGE